MKTRFLSFSHHFLILSALMIFLGMPEVENSRADVSLGVTLDQFGSPAQNTASYAIFLTLNTTNVPITYDEVFYSPSSNSYTGIGDGSSFNVFSLPDFNALAHELTNGTWKLIINAGDPSQQIFIPSKFRSIILRAMRYFPTSRSSTRPITIRRCRPIQPSLSPARLTGSH